MNFINQLFLPWAGMAIRIAVTLPFLMSTTSGHADGPLSCTLGLLKDLGWTVERTEDTPHISNLNTCTNSSPPLFTYNEHTEDRSDMLDRATSALHSVPTKCLVNRHYKSATKRAIDKITANSDFGFPPVGQDPRDPFIPPAGSWVASPRRGYDIPADSIANGITALYTQPFVAECATAVQIAQLAVLNEHYGLFTDAMLHPKDIGIGIWDEYAKNPSIAAHIPLLINSRQRKNGLRELARLGKGAFYGQTGYIRPVRSPEHIDSLDNRGQNFLIVDLTDRAVNALRKRRSPLRELGKISKNTWEKYYKKMLKGGDKKTLSVAMQSELESIDPFFSDIDIYVHPLKVKTFAEHLARQFIYNARTPFVFELYEDYQSGYFHARYTNYRLNQCAQQAHCRKVDRRHFVLTDKSGRRDSREFRSARLCRAAAQY